jgi:hypothetical protein
LKIHQTFYITKLLERLGISKCNPNKLLLPAGTVMQPDNNLLSEQNATVYRQIAGSAIYLSGCTRIDISEAARQLSKHMAKPGVSHFRHTKHLLRYLNGCRSAGIVYGDDLNPLAPSQYRVYTDSTWGTEHDRKSVQGMAVVRNGGACCWFSNRQKSIALSSMEAEIMAASEGAKEVLWLNKLRDDLNENHPFVPTLYCDNQGAVTLLHDTKFHKKAKHIEIRYLFIREELVQKRKLVIQHIEGAKQPADILTKQLPAEAYERHKKVLGIRA